MDYHLDIGLLTEPVDISKYDFIRLKEKEVWGVLMRKNDVLASKEYVTADLKGKIINSSRINILAAGEVFKL